MKTSLILVALVVLGGISTAQTPTAPAPRPVDSTPPNLTFTYIGPVAAKTSKLEPRDKVEFRWKMRGESYVVIATRMDVNGDVVSFTGTDADPVVISVTRPKVKSTVTCVSVDLAMKEGKLKVLGEITAPR